MNKTERAEYNRQYYLSVSRDKIRKNPEKKKEITKKCNDKLRVEVLIHYGSSCACCGIADLNVRKSSESLVIDHIGGGGNSQRKYGLTGYTFYRRLRQENYPSGFRVLCWNCNASMRPNEDTCWAHKMEVSKLLDVLPNIEA